MCNVMRLLVIVVFLAGCANSPDTDNSLYDKAIDWQGRETEYGERREGPSIDLQDAQNHVESLSLDFQVEQDDYWKTAREVQLDGMSGDCEDLSQYILVSLRNRFWIADGDMWVVIYNHPQGCHAVLELNTYQGTYYYCPSLRRWWQGEVTPIIRYNLFDVWE